MKILNGPLYKHNPRHRSIFGDSDSDVNTAPITTSYQTQSESNSILDSITSGFEKVGNAAANIITAINTPKAANDPFSSPTYLESLKQRAASLSTSASNMTPIIIIGGAALIAIMMLKRKKRG